MKSLWLTLCTIMILTAPMAKGQELLPNGSFEIISDCPQNVGKIELAKNWYQIAVTPDLFSTCGGKNNIVGIPKNYQGVRSAQEGNSYAGLVLYAKHKDFSFEEGYLTEESIYTPLLSTAEPDSTYEVSLWRSMAQLSNFYADEIVITLTDYEPWSSYIKPNIPKQIIVVKLNDSKSFDWKNNKLTFVATGKWKFMTIGYSRDILTHARYRRCLKNNLVLKLGEKGKGACYYYFDNISTRKIRRASSSFLK